MSNPKIVLYFDLHSPFSYLAFHTLRNDARFKACDITYVPVLLIAIFKHLKLQPPWDTPSQTPISGSVERILTCLDRVRNIENDLRRSAPYAGLQWVPGWPRDYPLRNTAGAQRALVAASLVCPEKYEDVVAEMYEAFWVEKEAIQTPQMSLPVIADVVGDLVTHEIAKKSITLEVSDKLTANTDEAIGDGACGLPWLKCTTSDGKTESYWGFDHVNQVLDFLNLRSTDKPTM